MNPLNSSEPNFELVRLLGRYAEAYFSKDGKDLPKTLSDIENYIAKHTQEARLNERQELALDLYHGHTFSKSTNWEAKFAKFIDNNENRIRTLKPKTGGK
jgi:hypothetical protein